MTATDIREAFFAGAGIADPEETERRFKLWLEIRHAKIAA